ncbi:MAG: hypothetical protein ABIR29_06085, partial [Chthoniobacterales bacterium]
MIKLLAIGAYAAVAFTTISAPTARAEEPEAAAKNKVTIPATTEGILAEIQKRHDELDAAVKDKKLADVHHHAFAIRDLARALPAKAPADKQARVQGAVNNLGKLAQDLDASGDAGDQAKTESNLKKFDAVLVQLE